MKYKRGALVILLILPLFLGMAVEEEEAHSSPLLGFLGKVINFLVLFGGLYFFLRKPLSEYLKRRSQEIGTAIEDAKKGRAEMEALFRQSSQHLSKLDEEIEKMRADAQKEGDDKKEQILIAAKRETSKIREWSRQEIDMFYKAQIKELKKKAADWATALAQRNIEEKMTPERQNLMLDQSIEKLEKFYEK